MKKRMRILSLLLSAALMANMTASALASDSTGEAAQTQESMQAQPGREMDGNGGPGANGEKPPEKPDGEAPEGMPAPDGMGGEMPQRPDGEDPEGMPGGAGEGGSAMGPSSESVTYSAVNQVSEGEETFEGEELTSTGTDENAVLVDGADACAIVSGSAVTRTSDDSDSGNTSSFYGNAAALLAADGVLYVKDSSISTSSGGGAGAFAYGDGTVYIANTDISTEQGTSGGIHAAGGGTLYAWDLNVKTQGGSSAAIRSDRGGGTMVVDGGTYTTEGIGSPAIYSTANIAVHNASLTAENSEATCIEGLNSIRLFDCDLTGNMPDDNEQNEVLWNVIVYQSMSGDSQEGNGTFEMVGGTLTAKAGGMFYTTNTQSTFILEDVDITYAEDSDFFLRCTGNANGRGWGQSGDNGAACSFTGISQEMQGDVIWDKLSTLEFYLTSGSTLTGTVIEDATYSGGEGDGWCNLYIDADSTWIVTGDAVLSALSCSGTITDEAGNSVTIVGADGTTYVEGTSAYTITVDSYTESADVSGASVADSWEDYAVELPAELA